VGIGVIISMLGKRTTENRRRCAVGESDQWMLFWYLWRYMRRHRNLVE